MYLQFAVYIMAEESLGHVGESQLCMLLKAAWVIHFIKIQQIEFESREKLVLVHASNGCRVSKLIYFFLVVV